MTHTTQVIGRESDGSYESVRAVLSFAAGGDGLDRANEEDFDPESEFGLSPNLVTLAGFGGASSTDVRYDPTTNTLHFTNDDGTDVAQGNDPGQVRVVVRGPGSA
jgi:hypothetical protein